MLLVSEVLQTIQGEATLTGTPSVFVRLQGCVVGCSWCDTKHTWPTTADGNTDVDRVFSRNGEITGIEWSEDDLLREISSRYTAKHIVITGGEPLAQNVVPFCNISLSLGYSVQIETSGTYSASLPSDVFLTVSPKIGMPGGRSLCSDMLLRADEIKMPIGKKTDVNQLLSILPHHTPPSRIWLQPLSQSSKATSLCIQECMAHNWRLSIQTHKFLGLP